MRQPESVVRADPANTGAVIILDPISLPLRARFLNAARRARVTVLVAVTITACSAAHDPVADYARRLLRTLDEPPPAVLSATPVRPPRSSQLQVPHGSLDINPLEFLDLGECAVQVTVARSNSSLGKLAPASQRLLLELEFLTLAPDCVNRLHAKQETNLAIQVQAAYELKLKQLPTRVFNATLGGPEFVDMWQPRRSPDHYPASAGSKLLGAMEALAADTRRWLSGDFRVDHTAFEKRLQLLSSGDGGQLLRALVQQAAALDALTGVVAQQELCFQGRPTPRSRNLLNVVTLFFAGEVQPRGALLEQRRYQLSQAVTRLEDLLAGALPPTYLDWQHARDRQLVDTAQAPRRHALALSEVLVDCGLGPGAS